MKRSSLRTCLPWNSSTFPCFLLGQQLNHGAAWREGWLLTPLCYLPAPGGLRRFVQPGCWCGDQGVSKTWGLINIPGPQMTTGNCSHLMVIHVTEINLHFLPAGVCLTGHPSIHCREQRGIHGFRIDQPVLIAFWSGEAAFAKKAQGSPGVHASLCRAIIILVHPFFKNARRPGFFLYVSWLTCDAGRLEYKITDMLVPPMGYHAPLLTPRSALL